MAVITLIWAGLVAFWGGFWRADQRLPSAPQPEIWPEVAAVIPARDEAEAIAKVVSTHGASIYPGAYRVVVVDDQSSDGTGELAHAAARGREVEVITAPPLPEGWSGKMNAVAAGITAAAGSSPSARYLLLTDADIVHAPETLSRLVALAEARGLAMVSLMARLDARGLWGRLLIPAFVFFFQKLYPFPWVNRPGHWMAAAAGGCMLVRRDVLEAAGGVAAIKGALIDDCALARLIKRHGGGQAIWLGLADRAVISLRDNRSFASIWTMVARTAFTQLGHSALLLAGCVAGMVLLYLGPFAAMAFGMVGGIWPFLAGLAAYGLMVMAYAPTVRLYGLSPLWALTLPGAAVLYTAMTVGSAINHWRGAGGRWKGRTYP